MLPHYGQLKRKKKPAVAEAKSKKKGMKYKGSEGGRKRTILEHDCKLMPLQMLFVQIRVVRDHPIGALHIRIVVNSLPKKVSSHSLQPDRKRKHLQNTERAPYAQDETGQPTRNS